ncbi:MAG TPA: hypothetical protein DD727_07330, partial [Clostridiales bacterium]|nr:hypothetical protein [Clostridiales bacterium]
MLRLLKSMARSMYATIARFPVTVMVSLTLGILLVYGNHHRNLPDLYTRINMTLGLAIPLTALATLAAGRFSQASRRKLFPWVLVAFQLAAGLLLFAYWLYMTPIGEDTGVYRNLRGFKLMGLVSVAALGFFAAQHFPRRKGFVMHVIRILIRILVTAIFTGVLCGGLDAIIFAADQLFDLNISNRIYTDVVFLVITVFTPLYFFGGVPLLSGKEDAGEEDTGKAGTEDYPGFLKVLFLYIVLPLLSVYMIIVLLYCLRVLLAGQPWPENRLLTLAFPVAPILTASLFLIAPLARIYRWPRIAISVLPIAVLPLFAMMFAGLAIRTQAYGMTEQRYFVWVMGGWTALVMIGMIYQRVKKTSGNGFQGVLLPVTLAVAVFFMVLGPVNAYRISQNSQNERLSRLFGSYGLLREGEIDREKLEARPAFSTEDRMEIQEILEYFRMKYSLSRVKVLNSFTEKDEIYALLGFDKPYPNMP